MSADQRLGLNDRAQLEVEFEAARRLSRRRFLMAAGAMGLTAGAMGLLAACGGGASPAPSSGPSQAPGTIVPSIGGKLRFYGWEGFDGMAPDAVKLTQWRKDNNVDLAVSYIASPDELLAKIRTDPGSIDIGTTHVEFYMRVLDLLEPLDLSRIPNYQTIWPALKSRRWKMADGSTYMIPALWGDTPCVYDPKKWPEGPPPRYLDLADPKYKGELVGMDDWSIMFWGISRSLGHNPPMRVTQAQLDQIVKEYIKIKPNIVALLSGSTADFVDILVRGDASMAPWGCWEPVVPLAADKGKELKFGKLAVDKDFTWVDNYAIPKASTNKDTAYAYINQLVGPKGNAELANFSQCGSTQSLSWDYLDPTVRGWYPYDGLKEPEPPDDSPVMTPMVPPLEPEGDILGVEAWQRAWQEAKLG